MRALIKEADKIRTTKGFNYLQEDIYGHFSPAELVLARLNKEGKNE